MGQQRIGSAGRWPSVSPRAQLTWLGCAVFVQKCEAQVLNFLPFVRLCRDLEFTEKLAAPNNTHIHPLEKFSLSPRPMAIAFYGSGWRGPGLSSGKFRVYVSPEDASSDEDERGQNPGWGTEDLGSHPAQLLIGSGPEPCGCGVGHRLLGPSCPSPPASQEAPGLHRPKVGHNHCQECLCVSRGAKAWAM